MKKQLIQIEVANDTEIQYTYFGSVYNITVTNDVLKHLEYEDEYEVFEGGVYTLKRGKEIVMPTIAETSKEAILELITKIHSQENFIDYVPNYKVSFSFEYKAENQNLFGETVNVPKMKVYATYDTEAKPQIQVYEVLYGENEDSIFNLIITYLKDTSFFEKLEKMANEVFETIVCE